MEVPAQPDAIVLGTGPLPGATAAESWHRQYGSAFARNVTVATLTPFLPDPAKANGAAVIVAPGGGFRTLSMENEGSNVARALASHGRRRVRAQIPAEPDAGRLRRVSSSSMAAMFSAAGRPAAPRSDRRGGLCRARAADRRRQRRLRPGPRRAAEWHVDPDRIGMVGFSAGAMLTMATALNDHDAKPAFIGIIYGPLAPGDRRRPTRRRCSSPLAADDPFFGNSGFGLIESWRAAKRPVEFHLYEQGGHGFGMYPKETTSTGWFDAFVSWLGMHGWVKPGE